MPPAPDAAPTAGAAAAVAPARTNPRATARPPPSSTHAAPACRGARAAAATSVEAEEETTEKPHHRRAPVHHPPTLAPNAELNIKRRARAPRPARPAPAGPRRAPEENPGGGAAGTFWAERSRARPSFPLPTLLPLLQDFDRAGSAPHAPSHACAPRPLPSQCRNAARPLRRRASPARARSAHAGARRPRRLVTALLRGPPHPPALGPWLLVPPPARPRAAVARPRGPRRGRARRALSQ
jgi:hypothetical protein